MRADGVGDGDISGPKINRKAMIASLGHHLADRIIGQFHTGLVMRLHGPKRCVELKLTHGDPL
jgi:hypothetical protein